MRVQNSLKNIFFGLSGQFISMIMGFIVRTVFIYTLGIEYLGIEGLFTSILIMLSLANLGFDTAMIYSLYKPIAEEDKYKIQALMNLYKKAYRIIAIVVLIIGLSLIPFLPYITDGATTISNINIIYILFLLNSVSSYYFVYKHSIIIADQRNHIISKIHSMFIFISNLIQITLLLIGLNYILILSTQIICRIVENGYIAHKANLLYPYLKGKNNATLTCNEKKMFFENLYALLLYKISGVVINGTDNLIISMFVGIAAVGIYSNYFLIIATLTTFLSYLFYSITASIGNLIVQEDDEKKYFIFRVLNFANFWIYGFCAVCLWNIINPFITLWLGENYLFDKFIVFAIILNFYTAGMQDATTAFRDASGLFKKGKYRPIIAAIINIVASIILAKIIGIAGVFLGTVFSRICTYFWYDPYIIFKFVFKKSVKTYFIRYTCYSLLVVICIALIEGLTILIYPEPINSIIIRVLCSLIIPNILFLMLFKKTDEFKYLFNILRTLILRFKYWQLARDV
ncbi:sugar translocase [Metabacillus dongyingensis]|uniref:lipopolysaccharide biosynthesis protein n=1 Tax=Metabacillus dongyingensis TaxID=2874282 RepID=UPI003B8D359B